MGAAIAKVSGQVDTVEVLEGRNEDEVIAAACEEARKKAIDAGADPELVQITSIDNMPLEYVATKATRLIIRAVSGHACYTDSFADDLQAGPLSQGALLTNDTNGIAADPEEITERKKTSVMSNKEKLPSDFIVSPSASVDIRQYRPEVDEEGTWWVSEIDCEFLATGCSVLACGGGGPGYLTYLAARAAIQAGHRLPVADLDSLSPDAWVMGSISFG